MYQAVLHNLGEINTIQKSSHAHYTDTWRFRRFKSGNNFQIEKVLIKSASQHNKLFSLRTSTWDHFTKNRNWITWQMPIHEIFARFLMNKKGSAKLVAKNFRTKEAFLFTFSISVSVDSIPSFGKQLFSLVINSQLTPSCNTLIGLMKFSYNLSRMAIKVHHLTR